MDKKDYGKKSKEDVSPKKDYEVVPERNTEQVITHRKTSGTDDFLEDFTCSVCFLIAVQPTSLVCGHTFCRICLAKWYLTTKRKVCPLCGQAYEGRPMVNIYIKNMIAKLCPKQLKEREETLETNAEDKAVLKKFEEELADKKSTMINNNRAFVMGIILSLFAFAVIYITWYWQFSERNSFASVPVKLWKAQDVKCWLDGISWASDYANKGIENNLDGNILLALDDESLLQLFNVTEPLHQKALLSAVSALKEHGIKMPATLWEYKALFLGRCLFLAYGLKEFPRFTILYVMIYFYDDIFLPSVNVATAQRVGSISSFNSTENTVSTSQWIKFWLTALILPQWLVIQIAYQMASHLTLLVIILNATLIQILEILGIVSFFRNNNLERRRVLPTCLNYGKQLLNAFILMIIWPVVPEIVCDLLFYSALYVRPIHMSRTFFRNLREL